jgi:hypothetical protein
MHKHLIAKLKEMRSFLNKTQKRRLYVTGALGCGKTCFFWSGILMKQNNKVLFIQYRAYSDCHIWVLEDGARKRLTSPKLTLQNLEKAVDDLLTF